MRIAFATCRRLPEPDHDEAPLLRAAAAAGHVAELVAWDDPAADVAGFDLLLLRSTWNYHERPDAFAAWLERAAARTRLCNPAPVVRWNMHKGYLRDLERAGVPIVPTEFVAAGSRASVAAIAAARGWTGVVVKPAISAASAHTQRHGAADLVAADAFLAGHLAVRDMMIQPYLASVETTGETNIVCIDGEPTHAVRKATRFAGGHEQVDALPLTAGMRQFALRVLAAAPRGAAYARVDVMYGDDGRTLLSELELIEPSLHVRFCPEAAGRLIAAATRPR